MELKCTTGFTWEQHHHGNRTGVTSAGHCEDENITHYMDEAGSASEVSEGGVHRGEYGDFMGFNTPGRDDQPQFYFVEGYRADVYGVVPAGDIQIGDFYCGFGRASHGGCSRVYHDNVRWDDGTYLYRRLVAMNARLMEDGDSGGPWYDGNWAAGIHKGGGRLDGQVRDVWSRADLISDAFPCCQLRTR